MSRSSKWRVVEQLAPHSVRREWLVQEWAPYVTGECAWRHYSTEISKEDALNAYEILSKDPGTIIIAGG